MTKAILNFKTDPGTKKQLQAFAAELGVPVSVIMNAQIKQLLRDHTITLSTELQPTVYLEKIMRQVNQDLKTGHDISPTFTSADDMFEHLENRA